LHACRSCPRTLEQQVAVDALPVAENARDARFEEQAYSLLVDFAPLLGPLVRQALPRALRIDREPRAEAVDPDRQVVVEGRAVLHHGSLRSSQQRGCLRIVRLFREPRAEQQRAGELGLHGEDVRHLTVEASRSQLLT